LKNDSSGPLCHHASASSAAAAESPQSVRNICSPERIRRYLDDAQYMKS
jgi:hypothetical protein